MKTGDPEVVVVLNRLAITVACLVAVIRWDCTHNPVNGDFAPAIPKLRLNRKALYRI